MTQICLNIKQMTFTCKRSVSSLIALGLCLEVASSIQITELYFKEGGTATLPCPEKPVDSWQDVQTNTFIATCNSGHTNVNLNTSLSNRVSVTARCDLIIKNINGKDTKIYRCFTPDNSHLIEIKFWYRPRIISSASTITLKTELRQPADISVSLLSYEKPSAAWVNSAGGIVALLVLVEDKQNSTKFLLTSSIVPSEDHHFGNYSIRLRNGKGTTTLNITLTYTNWRIYVEPTDVSCEKASTINIRCFINRKIFPSFSCDWHQYYNDVYIRSMDCVVQNGSSLLTLRYCDNKDAGRHTCVLKSNGTEFSASSIVSIKGPPFVTKTQKFLYSDGLRLTAFYISNPPAFEPVWFQGSLDGERQINTSSGRYFVEVSHSESTLNFYGIELNVTGLRAILDILNNVNDGYYICHVSNSYGTSEVSFQVTKDDFILSVTSDTPVETTNSTDETVRDEQTSNKEYIYGSVGGLVMVVVIVVVTAILCRRKPKKKVTTSTARIVQQRQRTRVTLQTRAEIPVRGSTSTSGYEDVVGIGPPSQTQSDEESNEQAGETVEINTVDESNYEHLDSTTIDNTLHEYGSCKQEKPETTDKDDECYIVPGHAYMLITDEKVNDNCNNDEMTA